MKELEKLAKILRSLDVYAKIEERKYHKTYWIGAKIVGISRLFDSVCTTK